MSDLAARVAELEEDVRVLAGAVALLVSRERIREQAAEILCGGPPAPVLRLATSSRDLRE